MLPIAPTVRDPLWSGGLCARHCTASNWQRFEVFRAVERGFLRSVYASSRRAAVHYNWVLGGVFLRLAACRNGLHRERARNGMNSRHSRCDAHVATMNSVAPCMEAV